MKKSLVKKILKIIGILFLVIIISFTILFYRFFKPKPDEQIIEYLTTEIIQPTINYIAYKDLDIRVIEMQKEIDTTLPTLIFVHGSPGSSTDFKKYLLDNDLNKKSNLITYDRVGYGMSGKGKVLNSLDEEVGVLHHIIKNLKPQKIILIGYSYGGTTVFASKKKIKKKILLAAAIKGDLEPRFWAMNLYKWKVTRPLIPKALQNAAQEKFRHLTELKAYENVNKSPILSIHGKKDIIVPFENSLFLKKKMGKNKFTLVALEEGRHSLVWTNFEEIKNEILKVIEE